MSGAKPSSEWQNDPRREDLVEQFGVLRAPI
jgi:hypothetical protein